ncbi:MAG: thrombospondin type 3 repeat-containing protein [Steroidobacteraceae bacterium]|nr:thrombospondin type 3 repeat-containing protein [Steroidobacteraceae bacterium]
MPTDTSIRLTYAGTGGSAQFETPINHAGHSIAPLRYSTGGKEYYVSTPETISFAGFYSPQVIVGDAGPFTADARFDEPVTLLGADGSAQQSMAVDGTGTVRITPTYGDRSLTYSGTVTYLGTEDVTTPLGTFSSRHVRLQLEISTAVEGTVFRVPFFVDLWFARDIGLVQRLQAGQLMKLVEVTGPDRDGDGRFDGLDAFPDDPAETTDFDHDGIGDNADPDDDNDGIADTNDAFPRNPAESADFDADGTGDNADPDDDNDGLPDVIDPFPHDIHNPDTDRDGTADFHDTDDDNDGFIDAVDRFPFEPAEWADADNDGWGDNGDPDDDNDGRFDLVDAYPLNPTRWEPLNVEKTVVTLAGVLGMAGGPGTAFNVTGENVRWQAETSAPWLQVSPTSGTGDTLILVNTTLDRLAPGTHAATLTFTDPDTARSVDVAVQLTVSLPEITVTSSMVSFDGKFGWSTLTQPVDVSLNTGLTSYPLSIETSFDPEGAITATYADGVADANPRRLNVVVDPSKLKGGRHAGHLTLTADVKGHAITRTVAVEVLASTRALFPTSDAVAFAQTDAYSGPIRRTIKILDSYGVSGTEWTATGSGESWLKSVTPSGVSDGELTIEVDPLGLSQDLYRATVTLSTTDPNIDRTVPINVSLWVDTETDPRFESVPATYKQLAADPLRPFVYAHNGSGNIDVYNIHVRELHDQITGLTGDLGAMVVSSDGKWLFVQNPVDGGITRIDLDDTNVRVTWPLADSGLSSPRNAVAYARPNGHPVLVLSDRRVVDAETGDILGNVDLPTLLRLDVIKSSFDGQRLCALNTAETPFSAECFWLYYGDYGTPDVKTGMRTHLSGHDVPGAGFATDLAITADGQSVIVAIEAGADYPLWGFPLPPVGHGGPLVPEDPTQMAQGSPAIATGPDNGVFASVITLSDGKERLRGWNDAGTSDRFGTLLELGSVGVKTGLRRQLVVSGDGLGLAYLLGSDPSPDLSTSPDASTELYFQFTH